MAETCLISFANFVLGKVGDVLKEEVGLVLGAEDKLEKLKDDMEYIQGVLKDAEEQQHASKSTKIWLQDLEDFLYEMDDLSDDIAIETTIQQKIKGGDWVKRVKKFFSHSNSLFLRFKLAHQIEDLCKRLEAIRKNGRDFKYNPEAGAVLSSIPSHSRETSSRLPTWKILGRDEDRDKIIGMVLSIQDCEGLSTIPIVGSGGLGKTTLVQLIYDDARIDAHFNVKLWVFVSEKFSLRKIIGEVIRLASGEREDLKHLSKEELRIRLESSLQGKKYFLILDDMWNEDRLKWIELRDLLSVGAKGSCVIVTTRSQQVKSITATIPERFHILEGLPRETCLSIFKMLAFGNQCGEEGSKFNDMAEEIVDKCGGVPLIVTVLGNLLHGIRDEREWKHVIQKLKHGQNDILAILKLSYDQLSPFLKPCFRIMSIFRSDKNFVVASSVIYVWIALGFISSDDEGLPMEHIGRKYFDELWSKSLLYDAIFRHGFLNWLKMHDHVRDLARSVSGNEIAVVDCSASEIDKRIRSVLFDDDDLSQKQFPQVVHKANKARLFKLQTVKEVQRAILEEIISNFKWLRVLDFSECDFEELPSSVGSLKHLRMLSLRTNQRIKRLPNSICKLLNLQTLILADCERLQEIPTRIGKLENLRHLALTYQQEYLPEVIGSLTALRHLALYGCRRLASLPRTMENLSNLDMLVLHRCDLVNFQSESSSIEALQVLNNVHTLSIGETKSFTGLPRLSGSSASSLENLRIFTCQSLSDLSGWIDQFTSLKRIRIENCPRLLQLPTSFSRLKKLERLEINGCPQLSSRCKTDDWALISHVSEVYFDGLLYKKW